MKAIISTTYSDFYLFFLPITTWCWNKLGVDVICFAPKHRHHETNTWRNKLRLAVQASEQFGKIIKLRFFSCPDDKESTYAQCSRLYAAALDLPEDEVLITSDIDMALFKNPAIKNVFSGETDFPMIDIFGYDLVPEKQFPICYISAPVFKWRSFMEIKEKSYQECLDELLGDIEAEHFRGNYWGKDQETAYNKIVTNGTIITKRERAKPGTQFATNRLDRDDAYLLDRLNPDIIDYHMPRPGYEENNFNQILTVLKYFYPHDDFEWLISYREQYINLL